jgi:hypothetical protein
MKQMTKLLTIFVTTILASGVVTAGPDGKCTMGPINTKALGSVVSVDGILNLDAKVTELTTICEGPEHRVVRISADISRADKTPEILFIEVTVLALDSQGTILDLYEGVPTSLKDHSFPLETSKFIVKVPGFENFEINL